MMRIALELTTGELALLLDSSTQQPRRFHDTADKLLFAEALIPRIQNAVSEAQQRELRAAQKRDMMLAAEDAIASLFTS